MRGIIKGFSELETSEMQSRLNRLLALDSIRTVEVYPGLMPESADSIDPFVREAVEAYVNGLYRSCIFSCATAVNQILVEKLMEEKGHDLYSLSPLREMTFGQVIGEAKKSLTLHDIVEDADWLNRVRNRVAAHCCYLTAGRARSQEELQFEIETMIGGAQALIDLLEPEDKARVESSTVTYKDRTITFGQALETKDRVGAEVVWCDLQFYVIPALALEAYKRLYRVMERLQIYVITRYHTRAPYEAVKRCHRDIDLR